MMGKININWYLSTDSTLLGIIGKFIYDTRLQQNKTQQQVAEAAGINRATLGQVEKGSGGTLLTLIQILRVLDQLSILKAFEIEPKISPLQIARSDQDKRRRARNHDRNKPKDEFKSTW